MKTSQNRVSSLRSRQQVLAAISVGFCTLGAPISAWSVPPTPPTINISSVVPPDIPGGAQNASLQDAAVFAWQEFIALNWPAKAGVRDTPDPSPSQKFGAATAQPLVWHTFRARNEIFPGGNSESAPPHGYTPDSGSNYGYNDPTQYVYNVGAVGTSSGEVQACNGQAPVSQPAWINLDEITQIGLDSMFAGIIPTGSTSTNSNPQLIRFMAKANGTEYGYVAANKYWYETSSSPRKQARNNFISAVNTGKFPPTSPYISFPAVTIEAKAAFRPLTPTEQLSNRFYSTQVRYYEQGANSKACYREETWGLIALHIIQKTPTAPAFIYATFEQADNLLTTVNGKAVPVEDENGNLINSSPTSTLPALTYKDDPANPLVSVTPAAAPACVTTGNPHLFYVNSPGLTGLPGGNICVNQRDHAIPPPIVATNQAAHQSIAAYSAANGISNSPWLYYKLVNVQAYPFNVTDIVPDPNSPRNAATFYQANIVVETNYTLQNFNGGPPKNGAPSNYTPQGKLYQQNAYVLNSDGTLKGSYDMGGCMGCHAVAQFNAGGDFSFIIGAPPARAPEVPSASNGEEVKARYRSLFYPNQVK